MGGDIEDILRGICPLRHDHAIDQGSPWDAVVDVADIHARVDGGRSGAMVLDVYITWLRDGREDRLIVKVDSAAAVAREWRAVQNMRRARSSRMLVAVRAVSGFIEDETRTRLEDQRAALVYEHVAEIAPYSDDPVMRLDDLVRDETQDVVHATRVITVLSRELQRSLWGNGARGSRPLDSLNRELGVDLVLEVEHASARTLGVGSAAGRRERSTLRHSGDILQAATSLEHPGSTSLAVGSMVEVRGITADAVDPDRVVGTLGSVSIEVRSAAGRRSRIDFTDHVKRGERDLVVVGRVKDVRTLWWWRRICAHDPNVLLEAEALKVGGIRVGQPFARLTSLLVDEEPQRTVGLTHGDLNPSNVLVGGGLVYAIDFARAADRPPLSDLAWLEVCLLRDVFAPTLPIRRLVRLQRLLGLAARLIDSMPPRWDPASVLGPPDGDVARAFHVIWAVRSGARTWFHGGQERPGWWRDYLAHLTLAALRTLKFDQDERTVHAVLTTAGVAAEWLGGRPYRYWVEPQLRPTVTQVISQVEARRPEAGDVLSEILAAVDYLGLTDDQTRDIVEAARDRCVAAWYSAAATQVLGSTDVSGEYISLRAIQGRPADLPEDLDTLGEGYRAAGPDRLASELTTTTSDIQGREGAEPARRRPADLLGASDAIELASRGGRHGVVVLLGDAGAGKTAVAREIQRRHARAVLGMRTTSARTGQDLPPMAPVALTATQIDTAIRDAGTARPRPVVGRLLRALGGNVEAALRLGAVHLTIDGFDSLDPTAYSRVAEWIRALHQAYKRTRVVICHRTHGFDPDELPFTRLVLQDVSEREAREYIRNRFKLLRPDEYEELTEELIRALSRDDVRESIREMAQTPRFLSAMIDWYSEKGQLPTHPRDLVSGLTERYLRERLAAIQPSPADFTYETCVAVLKALAAQVVDNDIDEVAALRLFGEHTDRPQELLNLLVGAGLVVRAGASIRFHRRIFHQYFAAAVDKERADEIETLQRRLRDHRDREALEVSIRFTDGARDVVHAMLETALEADPVFAARLLRWTDDPLYQDVTRFLSEQERTLFGPSGRHAWNAAVNALFEFGTDGARNVLHTVARNADPDPMARSAALAGLLRLRGITPSESRRPDAERAMVATVRRLLDARTHLGLRVQAINAVVDARLTSLVAYLAGLIDAGEPWPVVRAARRALASLDQILEPRQRAVYVAACERRLAESEAERMRAVEGYAVEELQDERWELIEGLSRAGRLDLVLPMRFSYETSEHFSWSGRRRLTAARRDDVPQVAWPAWDVLHGDRSPGDLVDLFATGDELVAIAAAHRLRAEHPERARELVQHVSATSSATRLLVIAETVPLLDDDGLIRVRAIATELIATMPVDRLEPLAALLASLPANKRSTRRLRLQAMIKLRQTLPTLVHGPLERLFSESERWSDAEVSQVALSGEAGRDLVLRGLSMVLYANDARELRPITLTPPAAEAILGYRPTTPADRVAYVRACTSAGLTAGLEAALAAAEDPATAALTGLSTHHRYGAEAVGQLGEVLTCVGYLARAAHEAGDVERSERAISFLRAFETAGHDRTVERGRLFGLALLGDWHPLLAALRSGDRPMHRGARNAILVWRPGPYTPEWGRDDVAVARHIGDRLAKGQTSLAPDVQSTLAEIRALVERRLGYVVLPDPS